MTGNAHLSRGNARTTLVLLYVALIVYALVTLMPFIWMLITSFKEPRDVFKLPPSFVPKLLFTDEPFANYSEIWTKRDFVIYFRNSAFVSFMAAIGQVFATSLGGYAFARLDLPGKNWLFALVLVTAFVPVEVTIIPEFLIMRGLGWVDTFLPLIGVAKEAVDRAFEIGLTEGVNYERRTFFALFATEDRTEGMEAFIEKRPANFKHR